jgi:hypothetical protein
MALCLAHSYNHIFNWKVGFMNSARQTSLHVLGYKQEMEFEIKTKMRVTFIGQRGACVLSNVNDLLNLQYYQRFCRSLWLYTCCVERNREVHPN